MARFFIALALFFLSLPSWAEDGSVAYLTLDNMSPTSTQTYSWPDEPPSLAPVINRLILHSGIAVAPFHKQGRCFYIDNPYTEERQINLSPGTDFYKTLQEEGLTTTPCCERMIHTDPCAKKSKTILPGRLGQVRTLVFQTTPVQRCSPALFQCRPNANGILEWQSVQDKNGPTRQ